jgi:spore coat protein H
VQNGVISCNRVALRLAAALLCLPAGLTACSRLAETRASERGEPATAKDDENDPSDEGGSDVSSDGGDKQVSTASGKSPSKDTSSKPGTQAQAGSDDAPASPSPMSDDVANASADASDTPAEAESGGAGTGGEAPSAPAQCQPRAGRYAVLEGESLTLNLSCAIDGAAPETWAVDTMPEGAELDAATGAFTWRPGLNQAATYKLTAQAMPWAESTTLTIAVVDRWDADGNQPLVDPTTYLEEYGLPVLHLNTDPGLNDDEYTPATIIYQGHTYVGSEAKHRGATSAQYPKRSFTLKFTKEDKFNEPNQAGGFREKRKITLITSFDDNSYLRQRLGYELWNRLDPSGHIRVQSYNVVVYLNGEYHGLYTIADHIDGYLMEDFGYDQEGNLYKARTYDANWRNTSGVNYVGDVAQPKETLHDGFTKEEGTPEEGMPGAFDDLDAFVRWAADSSDEEFAATIDSTIARKEYEDWWLWVSFIKADDSAGKNSYHYRDPLLADSVWHCIPWDLNASFGQDWKTFRSPADSSPPDAWFRSVNNLFDRILSDPELGPALEARYNTELQGPLARATILELYDGMVAEVEQSAQRDEQKWQADYRSYMLWRERTDFTTFQQEAEYLRAWIGDRHDYIDSLY